MANDTGRFLPKIENKAQSWRGRREEGKRYSSAAILTFH